ncbi:hypothetical protein A5714_07565 [Mycobacterium sp. E2462]|uniref:helix-turn-helix transcriptional regulator n=1 Tax=Mycobacterium sp. E2462 TaxID=1834133 RepID=UPI0007FD00BF|nr:LuxR C-terminal-related transcriptional regulator [Mycobacterium sp. E2462]OBI20980.1 hypothetical protein A5714_07565 [Mycobacterium sp. E2462]
MDTIEDFSRIAAAIHSSAVNPDNWTAALGDIRHLLDGHACALTVSDGANTAIRNGNVVSEAQAAYSSYYYKLDYVLKAVERGPVGVVRDGRPLMALQARSEFDVDFMRPHEVTEGLFVRLTTGRAPTCLLIAGPRPPDKFTGLVSALVPHLQQALRTQAHLDELRDRGDGLRDAAHALRHGFVVVAPGPRIVHTNVAADEILRTGDGLRTHAGRVEAVNPHIDAQLQRSVHAATGPVETARRGDSLTCPRRSGRRPYRVDIVPLGSATLSPASGRAMIVIVDPEDQVEPPAALLRRAYALTEAEAAVALLALEGHGVKHISEKLSLSLATVKTHLQHVFDKTGTHRQAELVRLLLAMRSVCR